MQVGVHEAVVAGSAQEHARLVAPKIIAALDAGRLVAAAVDADHRAALRAQLGKRTAAVEWIDLARLHRVPAFTIAQQISRFARRAATTGTRALAIGQHDTRLPGSGGTHWPRLEIAFNVVVADLPLDVSCLYPANAPDLWLAGTTHPSLCDAMGQHASGVYVAPETAVASYPAPPPADLGAPTATINFTEGALSAIRHKVGEVAGRTDLDLDQVDDLVLAVSEIVTNSLEHGHGDGVLRVWRRVHGIVAEVVDRGGGMMGPFPGLRMPRPEEERGRGLWLAAELCDVLQVWAFDDRTIVRVEMSAQPH